MQTLQGRPAQSGGADGRLSPERIKHAVEAWVGQHGIHHRERGGGINFGMPGRDEHRKSDPPARFYRDSGFIRDAHSSATLGAKELAEREGLKLREFVDRYAPEGATASTRPRPPSAPAPDAAAIEARARTLEAAWTALQDAAGLDGAASTAWLEDARGLWAPPAITAHVVVVDAATAGPLLDVCGAGERRALAAALPVAVTPLRELGTGKINGLAWRQCVGANRRVLSGSRMVTPAGVPNTYGNRADLVGQSPGVLVVEGMADTLAAESLLPASTEPCPIITVVGAFSAGQLPGVVEWCARQPVTESVCVVHHWDTRNGGEGAKAAGKACLHAGPKARILNWPVLCRELVARGVPGTTVPKDLADVVKAARAAGCRPADVWGAIDEAWAEGKPVAA